MTPARLTVLLSAVVLAGCGYHANERHTLGGALELDALRSTQAESPHDLASVRTTTLTRTEWEARSFLVPVDGTVHGPTWTPFRLSTTSGDPRRRGLYPTPESTLSLAAPGGTLAHEGLAAVPLALLDAATLPVQALFSPPWSIRQSPKDAYKRTEQSAAWYPGPLPDEGATP